MYGEYMRAYAYDGSTFNPKRVGSRRLCKMVSVSQRHNLAPSSPSRNGARDVLTFKLLGGS